MKCLLALFTGGNTFHWAANDDGVRRQSSGSSARQPKDKGKITGRKGESFGHQRRPSTARRSNGGGAIRVMARVLKKNELIFLINKI
ncbi:hypothetical protein ERO13_D13G091700v2 [Gossypium hirsutum]|uniref:Uncharacterized protein n=2 Tax=Gossypium TaxID=3633 RepID=A0A5J5NJF2_GOSBA|nr:hypothetical protein ES319_D13G102800v1 [Gossypium barbadense]KAG4111175.1 hypothetical protein ERO13_D13G091700v2 [Gossypium hirsutum]TYG37014.1 hypothetical protein ES288_D13G108600v1 [Gossypium darwinii]